MSLDDLEKSILGADTEPAVYEHPSADFVAVFIPMIAVPLLIAPTSERAKELCKVWGLPEDATGIDPPIDFEDFSKSIPKTWTLALAEVKNGLQTVVKIALPQPLLVVH